MDGVSGRVRQWCLFIGAQEPAPAEIASQWCECPSTRRPSPSGVTMTVSTDRYTHLAIIIEYGAGFSEGFLN